MGEAGTEGKWGRLVGRGRVVGREGKWGMVVRRVDGREGGLVGDGGTEGGW